tara:strand:+ start:329 stop:922 length:594 start_codon:yes stop_codon:yes gene_type:complete
MLNKPSFSNSKKIFLILFSAFLFGTEYTISPKKSSASPGMFEYQWDRQPGYRQLKYYQSSTDPLDRATYYFFLRGQERKDNIIKLTLKVPDYFDAKIKSEKLSLCKVKVGGFTSRTRCLEKVPSVIEINENQTSIQIFPERPITRDKDTYAVVMKIFNPRKTGMFQIQALSQSQQPGEIPISTYLGTWNLQVVGRVE